MTTSSQLAFLPAHATETQEAWAARALDEHIGLQRSACSLLVACGAEGITPWEAVRRWDLPERKIVSVRAAFTILHQTGEIVRCNLKRHGEHVYVAPWAWCPRFGLAPSLPHHGRKART